jgi:hypothetical protein
MEVEGVTVLGAELLTLDPAPLSDLTVTPAKAGS